MKCLHAIAIAAAVLCLAVSCGRGSKPVSIDWEEGKSEAVVLLGYYDSFESFESSDGYASVVARYPWVETAQKVVRSEPGALYLKVSKESSSATILLCSPDDDAIASLPDKPEVQILESSSPEPLWSYDTATSDQLGFSVSIRDGLPVVNVHYESLIGSYVSGYEITIPDGENAVNGLDGFAKGVFIGDIGQDTNPILCVITDDGGVRICSLLDAVSEGSCSLSDKLEGFENIVGFVAGTGGEDFAEYVTIYAVDSRGARKEIPLFIASGTYYCMPDGGGKIEADLSSGYRMKVKWLNEAGSVIRTMSGKFRTSGTIEDGINFSYTILKDSTSFCWAPGTASISHIGDSDYGVEASAPLSIPKGSVFRSGYGPDIEPDYGEEYSEDPSVIE